MGAMLIARSETMVETPSYDIPVADHITISWTSDSVLCMWCFNGNIKYSHYFRSCKRSSLTTELNTELPFDMRYIVNFWEIIGSPSK